MQVDIIIATYNRAKLLIETLKSVVDQTYPHWRYWIAEDGETKETLDAVKPFLQDNRFIYLPGKHTGSPAAPRNRAIHQGDATFIAFLDDDDLWLPEKLERQAEFMEQNPDCVLLGTNAFCWSGAGNWKNLTQLYFQKKRNFGQISYELMVKDNYLILSSAMIRRTVLEQSGLFNETLSPPIGEDYGLWLRIGSLGEIWVIPEPLVVYRKSFSIYYPQLDRHEKYQMRAKLLDSALRGVGGIPSPLSYPENERLAAACRYERDFYRAGPRFLGRLRHEMALKIKGSFSS